MGSNFMEQKARKQLSKVDRQMGRLIKEVGALNFSPRGARTPFESLVRAVAHQQLHGAAAESILGRFCELFPGRRFPRPEEVLRKRSATLRKVGFSEAKVLAVRDIAAKAVAGLVPATREIALLSDDEIITRLTQVRGVGRWTVEMLLIFQLGRPDVFPAEDFGVRSGYEIVYGADSAPKPRDLRLLAERFAPYRTYAALYLWEAVDRSRG